MCVLGLDGSMTFLVANSRAVKTTSQDASGGSFLTGLDHLSVCRVSNMSFPFVFVSCSKAPSCMGSKMQKEFIYTLSMLIFLHSFLLASGRNKPLQWIFIQVILTTSEKVGRWGAWKLWWRHWALDAPIWAFAPIENRCISQSGVWCLLPDGWCFLGVKNQGNRWAWNQAHQPTTHPD